MSYVSQYHSPISLLLVSLTHSISYCITERAREDTTAVRAKERDVVRMAKEEARDAETTEPTRLRMLLFFFFFSFSWGGFILYGTVIYSHATYQNPTNTQVSALIERMADVQDSYAII